MARTQSADYANRRDHIVEAAAQLFAEKGFLGASVADLAEACGSSKSLIYHYYPSKEDILFDVMHSHVKDLLDAAEAIAARPTSSAEKLKDMTRAFMQFYLGAQDRQRVLLNELDFLPAERRRTVVDIQRKLIALVEKLLTDIQPALAGSNPLRMPAAMLYFGMINWMHTWLDAKGRASPASIAELASGIFLDGIQKVEIFP